MILMQYSTDRIVISISNSIPGKLSYLIKRGQEFFDDACLVGDFFPHKQACCQNKREDKPHGDADEAWGNGEQLGAIVGNFSQHGGNKAQW